MSDYCEFNVVAQFGYQGYFPHLGYDEHLR